MVTELSEKQIEQYKQAMAEIDEMLVCPECGNKLAYYTSDAQDNWCCSDCHSHAETVRWIYSVSELDAIWQDKQRATE